MLYIKTVHCFGTLKIGDRMPLTFKNSSEEFNNPGARGWCGTSNDCFRELYISRLSIVIYRKALKYRNEWYDYLYSRAPANSLAVVICASDMCHHADTHLTSTKQCHHHLFHLQSYATKLLVQINEHCPSRERLTAKLDLNGAVTRYRVSQHNVALGCHLPPFSNVFSLNTGLRLVYLSAFGVTRCVASVDRTSYGNRILWILLLKRSLRSNSRFPQHVLIEITRSISLAVNVEPTIEQNTFETKNSSRGPDSSFLRQKQNFKMSLFSVVNEDARPHVNGHDTFCKYISRFYPSFTATMCMSC